MRQELDKRLERIKKGALGSDDSYGRNGAFFVTGPKGKLQIIASDQEGWEHVSVSPVKNGRTPTWKEMVFVKDLFWGEEEVVVQFHPAKSQYVNAHPYVLHLWKPVEVVLPTPPAWMVGVPGVKISRAIPDGRGGMLFLGHKEVSP